MTKNNIILKETNKIKNNWANIGLIVGILSVFFASIGIIPLSGIVINIIGIYKSGRLGGVGKWLAVIGLILSLVYTLVYMQIYGHIQIL